MSIFPSNDCKITSDAEIYGHKEGHVCIEVDVDENILSICPIWSAYIVVLKLTLIVSSETNRMHATLFCFQLWPTPGFIS